MTKHALLILGVLSLAFFPKDQITAKLSEMGAK